MKTNRIIFAALLTAFLGVSCSEEYDYQKKERISAPAVLSLNVQNVEDTVALMSPKTKSYTVNVTASSIADEMLSLTVAVDPSRVVAFNKEHGTSLDAVPGDAFELSSSTLMLPRYNTVSTTAQLTLKSSAMPEDGSLKVLALSITKIEGKDNINMSASDSTVFILFRRKALPASGFELGSGTEADPYIIRNQLELISMVKGMKSGKTYFKMDADVDMSDYEDWIPLNAVSPYDMAVDFDGCGHTITGFNCSASTYPSMFGVLAGSFRNVTFENPVITVGNSSAGLLGAQCGTVDVPAEIKNVKVNNLTINMNGTTEGVGGLAGRAIAASFSDITLSANILDADNDGKVPNSVGGLVGVASDVPSSFTNVHTSGSVTGSRRTSGLVAYIVKGNDNVTIEKSSSSMNINGFGQDTGGLVGLADGEYVTVSDSHSSGEVVNNGHYAGGLIGGLAGYSTIRRCYVTGNVLAKGGNHIGGLIGNATRTDGGTTIEDCYVTGNVTLTASNGRIAGGLVGGIENKTDITIRRCYASGDISSETSVVGGLVGFAKSKTLTDNNNFKMEHCIAWNKTLTNKVGKTWSSGGIIAVSNTVNTLTGNYRRPDMVLNDTDGKTLFDCADASPSAPLPYVDSKSYYYPYHGIAAPAGSTISSVAKSIGWPEDVWDLSGDEPKLK